MSSTLIFMGFLGYMLGAVPFGVLVARLFGLGDLTRIGSGNIGATNVLRTGNKKAAALTLLLDMAKGWAAVLIARALGGDDAGIIAGFGAFIGHLFPVWLGFKGGKGVATFLGVMFGYAWVAGLIAAALWLITAFFGRVSSLSALLCALLSPIAVMLADGPIWMILAAAGMGILIWIRHWENVARLLNGTEPRIGSR